MLWRVLGTENAGISTVARLEYSRTSQTSLLVDPGSNYATSKLLQAFNRT